MAHTLDVVESSRKAVASIAGVSNVIHHTLMPRNANTA
jgi:hypothetical protein